MQILYLSGIVYLVYGVFCTGQTSAELPPGWSETWRAEPLIAVDDDCRVSRVTRYDMARGKVEVPISRSPHDNFEWPRIEPMNSTASEQWEFDGISQDGKESFCFGFYRDPTYSFLGTGNLRAYVEFGFANGSRYAVVDYAEESTIVSCPGHGTRCIWRGDEAKGVIVMTSVASPRYADNNIWPSESAVLATVPHFYWVEPVPVADLYIEAVIKGESVEWAGMGGHERLWGAFNWYTCLDGMVAIRLRAGPYALSFVQFDSARQKGLRAPALMLAENGTTVFRTRLMRPSKDDDYAVVRKVYDQSGFTTSILADKATGQEHNIPAVANPMPNVAADSNVICSGTLSAKSAVAPTYSAKAPIRGDRGSMDGTAAQTRSPIANLPAGTPDPTATTMPAQSPPAIAPSLAMCPVNFTSTGFTATAAVLIRSMSGSNSGRGTSRETRRSPTALATIAVCFEGI
ncbi:hypothetical protein DL769_002014 [Monosporascus sp. CRB-8-3]|nr:hypothetical protein DL769_002014 [Monosporascus sp. CRB-8-3]